ncbi:MAG: DinB family protein [Blastocatellales bacterium]
MTFHTIAEILAENERAQERFVSVVSGLNDTQAGFRPFENEWTIGEIVEHVSIVNNGFLRITRKLLRQAESEAKPAPSDLNLSFLMVDEAGVPIGKFEAPETVRPNGGLSIAQALASMRQTLDGFIEIKSRVEAVDLSDQMFPHPAFGPMSAYQWMLLLSEHQDRHLRQIERVIASPGFPA